ncbi:MAG: ABC transporter ATP-binding protein [Actinomycetaceae bacterium]|nr:ABC transporter ATP-binding protein [Actinomycetaceae bacterium]
MTEFVVDARDVVKTYGDTTVLEQVSLQAGEGEIVGLIGPNGAGKTTLVECLAGLRRRDGGRIEVLGRDPSKADADFYRLVNIQPQAASLIPNLRVGEVLRLFASFYEQPREIGEIVASLGLDGLRGRRVDKLSGGQRQRVLIGTALIGRPRLVFLDELTTGLDPQTRIAMWEVVERMREVGTTVVLTTHFMEEAERLADKVAVIDGGQILAQGTVRQLVAEYAPGTRVTFADDARLDVDRLRAMASVRNVSRRDGVIDVEVLGESAAAEVVVAVAEQGVAPRDVNVTGGGLEDVFLALTGRRMRKEG